MEDIGLNIHGLVRGAIESPPRWLAKSVNKHLERFITPDSMLADPDFTVRVESSRSNLDTVGVVPGPQHRLGCVVRDGQRGVFVLNRDRPDTGIFPAEPVIIECAGGKQSGRRTYGLILVAIDLALRRKSGMLFHGACLSRNGRTALVVGARGSCKTMLVLTLLRRGWDYLADDKMLLADGVAHLFEDILGVRDHHLLNIPWLRAKLGSVAGTGPSAIRNAVARAGASLLPKRYITPWERKWDERHAVRVREIFPEVNTMESLRPDILVHLRPSDRFASRPLGREDARRVCLAIQRMMFQEMTPLEDLLVSFCGVGCPALAPIVAENLAGFDFYELDVAVRSDPEEIGREFERCVAQA